MLEAGRKVKPQKEKGEKEKPKEEKSVKNTFECLFKLFRSRRWGPRARVCARETLRSAPIDMSGIFRRMCLQSHLQSSPPTPQKSYPKFRNPRTTFEIFKKKL